MRCGPRSAFRGLLATLGSLPNVRNLLPAALQAWPCSKSLRTRWRAARGCTAMSSWGGWPPAWCASGRLGQKLRPVWGEAGGRAPLHRARCSPRCTATARDITTQRRTPALTWPCAPIDPPAPLVAFVKRGEAAAAGVPEGAPVPGFSPAEAAPVAAEFSAKWQHMVETVNRCGCVGRGNKLLGCCPTTPPAQPGTRPCLLQFLPAVRCRQRLRHFHLSLTLAAFWVVCPFLQGGGQGFWQHAGRALGAAGGDLTAACCVANRLLLCRSKADGGACPRVCSCAAHIIWTCCRRCWCRCPPPWHPLAFAGGLHAAAASLQSIPGALQAPGAGRWLPCRAAEPAPCEQRWHMPEKGLGHEALLAVLRRRRR